jgi:hypothetical protein
MTWCSVNAQGQLYLLPWESFTLVRTRDLKKELKWLSVTRVVHLSVCILNTECNMNVQGCKSIYTYIISISHLRFWAGISQVVTWLVAGWMTQCSLRGRRMIFSSPLSLDLLQERASLYSEYVKSVAGCKATGCELTTQSRCDEVKNMCRLPPLPLCTFMVYWLITWTVLLSLYSVIDKVICYCSIPVGAGIFSLHHRVRNGSGAYAASFAMGAGGSFPVPYFMCTKIATAMWVLNLFRNLKLLKTPVH